MIIDGLTVRRFQTAFCVAGTSPAGLRRLLTGQSKLHACAR